MKRLPLAKPDFDHHELEAVQRVLESGWVIQGTEVDAFEAAISEMHRAQHCIVVSSGTAALHICYLAMGIGQGDAVFIPSFAWPSAANMALITGARPIYVDVDPRTYNIDPTDLRARIEQCHKLNWGRPRAVVPVHQFGLAADMDALSRVAAEFGMEIIEDAACALGATYAGRPVGHSGKMAIFSFHPRKAITTGEGGAIITNDDELAARCRTWRNHGQISNGVPGDFVEPGLNYRMTEIQAAIGRVQLQKLPRILQKRRELANCYYRELVDCADITLPCQSPHHTWQTFMVLLGHNLERPSVMQSLATKGIEVRAGSVAGHCGRLYQCRFGYERSDLPISARLHERGLALPLCTGMEKQDVVRCATELRALGMRSA